MKRLMLPLTAAVMAVTCAVPANADDARITQDMIVFETEVRGEVVRIARAGDPDARLENEFAKTSRACPPFCIHPMSAGEGVETVGELEVIGFLETAVAGGTGLLVDSRLPEWHGKGTIPGAINIPFSTLDSASPFRAAIFEALGGRPAEGGAWDFSGAKELVLFCNGPWYDQSPRAIRNLLDAGFPAEKLRYYRGGMQVWQLLGLSMKLPAT